MNAIAKPAAKLIFLGVLSLLVAAVAEAQAPGTQPQQQTPAQKPEGDKPAPQSGAITLLDTAPAPVTAEEDAAIKVFRNAGTDDLQKKDQSGLDFLQKYPQSRYRAEIYEWQVFFYFSRNQVDKMEAAGDKALELNANDPQTLAIVGMALPRAMSGVTEPQKRLDKAEKYCQKALDLLPTLPNSTGIPDEAFQKAKNQTASFAYSGLGMVSLRRGKFSDAVPNFEKSIRLDPQPDPVNYYLLGVSNQKSSHFDDAVSAFIKCAAMPGGLQSTCTQSADEAKKLAATQLSAPK